MADVLIPTHYARSVGLSEQEEDLFYIQASAEFVHHI